MKISTLIKTSGFIATLAAATTSSAAGPCCAPPEASNNVTSISAPATTEKANPLVSHYTALSEALVMDDLAAARTAASKLVESARDSQPELAELAKAVAQAEDLNVARERLIPLSRKLIELVENEEGLFVMQCPMVKDGEWLQTNRDPRNPYMGQRMVRCGIVKRTTGE